jgi:hypothetical protein
LRVERPNRRLRLESSPRPECESERLRDLLTADKREEIFAIEIIVYAKPLTSLGTTRSIIYRLANFKLEAVSSRNGKNRTQRCVTAFA